MTTPLEKKYINACFEGDIDLVLYMFKHENKRFKNKKLLSSYYKHACLGGHINIFDVLYEYNHDFIYNVTSFRIVLKYAFMGGNWKLIKKLENIYDNIIYSDNVGDNKAAYEMRGETEEDNMTSNILTACESGKLEIVDIYIKYIGSDKYLLCSCLYNACKSGCLDLVNFILDILDNLEDTLEDSLEYSSEDNFYNSESEPVNWDECLSKACESGNLELVNLCISKGATNWNYGLNGACQGGYIEIVKFMISKGAIANKQTNNCMRHALWYAGNRGNLEVIKYLIDNEADEYDECMIGACTPYTVSHVHTNEKIKIIELMISKGANKWSECIDAACNYYFIGHYSNNIDIIKLIVLNGMKQHYIFTIYSLNQCLLCACICDDLDLIKMLVSMGANAFDKGLQDACFMGHVASAKLMLHHILESDGEPNLDNKLFIAVDGIEKRGTGVDVVYFLLNMGASANLECMGNTTDFQLYCKYSQVAGLNPNKYNKLLKEFPPYILFVGSQVGRYRNRSLVGGLVDGGIKKLPIDIFRLLFAY